MREVNVRVYEDINNLADAAARLFFSLCKKTLEDQRLFTVLLSGGSTPRLLYQRLGNDYSQSIDWNRVHFFFGDERCVPVHHPESNQRMVQEVLISRLSIPKNNLHRIEVDLPGREAAAQYELDLTNFFPPAVIPQFDLVLLGIGDDGHTASLFPGDRFHFEETSLVVHVPHRSPPPPVVDRISVTLPLINHAHSVVFLVSGHAKAAIVQRILSGTNTDDLPAGLVKPVDGTLILMMDEAAAGNNYDSIPSGRTNGVP